MSQPFLLLGLFLILAYFVLAAYRSYQRNRLEPEDESWDEEWDCPECGFHVQAGTSCVYCGTSRPSAD